MAGLGGDSGRLEGSRSLAASRLNLLGPYNDDATRRNAVATRRLVVRESQRGSFRTPSLRNVVHTGPYLHNGQDDRLQDALQHLARTPAAPGAMRAAPLAADEVRDLAAFLASLSDPDGERRPWMSTGTTRCP